MSFKIKAAKNTDVKNIEAQIKEASSAYYRGEPIMSDAQFDAIEDQLREQDPNNAWFKQVTRETAEYGKKIAHKYILIGSVDKVHSIQESKLVRSCPSVSISLKLDGSSMVVYYVDGKVQCALTRGDGQYGIDVTSKYNKIVEKYNVTAKKYPRQYSQIKKNDIMRLSIELIDGIPHQYIRNYVPIKIERFFLNSEIELKEKERDFINIHFSIENSFLYKFRLIKLPNGLGGFNVTLHHIICDAWSMSILIDQIVTLYSKLKNRKHNRR